MVKIFQIGFNKCGTHSLHEFFKSNGFKSVHWDWGKLAKTIWSNYEKGYSLLSGYEDYECFTDMESLSDNIFIYLTLFKELDKQYPNSKFILNTRNRDKWIKSRLNHKGYIETYISISGLDHEKVITRWIDDWENHIKNVKGHFSQRPDDLLIFDIEKESHKLIEFMSKIRSLSNKEFLQYYKTEK